MTFGHFGKYYHSWLFCRAMNLQTHKHHGLSLAPICLCPWNVPRSPLVPALKQSNSLYGYNSPMNSRLHEVLVCGYRQWHLWFEEIPKQWRNPSNNFLQKSITLSHMNILGQHKCGNSITSVQHYFSYCIDLPSPNIVRYSTLVASLQTVTANLASDCLNLVVWFQLITDHLKSHSAWSFRGSLSTNHRHTDQPWLLFTKHCFSACTTLVDQFYAESG